MTSSSSSLRAAVVSALGAGVMALFATASCASAPEKDRVTDIIQPDFDTYAEHVDAFLGRRCGSLDCHGQPGRAYRIYGRQGFRLYNEDAGLISGGAPTTVAEVRANFQALIALEPEEFNRVMALQGDEAAINRWIWMRKARKIERHKGGPALAPDDSGYRCLRAWLQIPVVRGDGSPIPPAERRKLTDIDIANCAAALAVP